MNNRKPIIFSDFDGTFTDKDIGYRLFTHFSGGLNQSLVGDWKKGLISSKDCLLKEAEMIRTALYDIHSFLDAFSLSSGAMEFYQTVKQQKIPFYIVSDGVDIYIDYVLKKHGLEGIRHFCNRGEIRDGRLIINFPYDNDGCVRCGCCKGARIRDLVRENRPSWEVIFIGDGLSDICAVPKADIIFAKGDLLEYCRAENATAIEYENFFDILNHLKESGRIFG